MKSCKDCNNSIASRRKSTTRCSSCWNKYHKGEIHSLWKGGKTKCTDCKEQVKNFYAKRCLICSRNNQIGQNSAHWKGGVTPINTKVRNSTEYKLWRSAVFQRDNYTCQLCNKKNVYFHADHIKSFSSFPELRMKISNGRTLCVPCHYQETFKRDMGAEKIWGHHNYKLKSNIIT